MKTIKTDVDHAEALAEIDRLVETDPAVGTPAAERLQILTLLVRDFESRRFPRSRPTPLEAIRFRMEQQGLSQRDLVPFFGSRSRVSEVLAGKRPLTLPMIRALHTGLGIPADALLQDQPPSLLQEEEQLQWSRFPVREMVARKWVECKSQFELREDPEAIVRRFLAPLGGPARVHALYRRTRHIRSGRRMDRHALAAWTLRVAIRGLDIPTHRYTDTLISKEFLREVVQLSWSSRGPLLAQEFLQKHGIALIIERHLPGTHLDGAAVMAGRNRPIIGLTLRYDRIDNFWFCLLHELAHLSLHVRDEADGFYDDLDTDTGDDTSEREADKLAGEALVPEAAWAQSPARNLRSPEAARHLAERLRIHPAIVAGRMRHKAKNFRILNQLVGSGEVRILFQEIWPK